MVNVCLLGKLGDLFGREWQLDIRSPIEAIRAINAQIDGFALSLIHISEPTRPCGTSRMPSSA